MLENSSEDPLTAEMLQGQLSEMVEMALSFHDGTMGGPSSDQFISVTTNVSGVFDIIWKAPYGRLIL